MTRKRLIITSVFSVVLVSILMMGTTYSIFTSRDIEENKNVYTTGNLDVTYTLSSDNVTMSNNTPTSNSDSLYIKPYRITVTNNGNVPYMFNVMLNDTTASNVVDYQYIMLQVGKLDITSLADCTDNVIKDDVIVPAKDSVDIDVRVWLSDTVQNSEIEKSFYAKLSIDGIAIYDNFDEIDNSVLIAEYSEYNVPNLDTGLVPVYYDNTNEVWKKADSTNLNHSWYDYGNKMWANAILKDSNTVVDLSNNIRNAVVKEATWDRTSKTVSTDGSSTYVNVGLASYDFKQSITLVARVKFLELPSGSNKEFLGNWEGAGGGLGVYSSTFNFSLYTGSSYKYFCSTMAPVVDTWYTVVATYNGSKLALYVNGEALTLDTSQSNSTDSATGNIAVSSVPFTLGGNPQTDSTIINSMKVTFDSFLIFDRALTASEIADDYSEVPNPTNKDSLLVYYDFSDYDDIPVDTTISDSSSNGTLAFYVWIPRFKYRVWNITRQAGTEDTYAYPAYTNGIDIEFEKSTSSTGNVECTYHTQTVESETNLSDVCVFDETDTITTTSVNTNYADAWYTHPAFTFGDKELTGFWIGKFETAGTTDKPLILPNVQSFKGSNLSGYFTMLKKIQTYGLSSDIDAHMATNLEWGAVAYLTHSLYGLCDVTSCRDVYINNSSGYYTGRSGGAFAGTDALSLVNVYGSSKTTSTDKYNTNGYYTYKGYFIDYSGNVTTTQDKTKVASTTGNITGVYDMSGGNREFLMANMVDSSNAFFPASSGTSWNGSSTLDSKYYNSYSYSSSNITDNQAVMNRARLGDATAENSGPYSGGTSAWQPGIAITGILSYYTMDPWPWVRRGGNYSEAQSGIFASGNSGGETDANSARSSLS